jgi:glucose/arabinose dehydrogenase
VEHDGGRPRAPDRRLGVTLGGMTRKEILRGTGGRAVLYRWNTTQGEVMRRHQRCPALLGALLTFGLTVSLHAQDSGSTSEAAEIFESARHNYRVVTVVEELEYPWSMTWLPDGGMLLTERPGRLRLVRDGFLDPTPIFGLPTVYRARGQGGFMDVVLHPEFAQNQLLYLSYGKPNEDASMGTTTVVRGRLDGHQVVETEEIFESDAWGGNNNHFAGRMVFDLEGYLYVAVGDRMADPGLLADHPAQDLTNHMGTIVRLHDDGSVPPDNPFVGHPSALPEIWSYGHRNIQGLTVDPITGDVWSNEHGPRGGDELNLILPGRNYGWSVATLGVNYSGTIITTDTHLPWIESPRFAWIPSIGTSGMMIYAGDAFPWWRGSAFVGGLVGEQLARVTLNGHVAVSEESLVAGSVGRIRDVREGPDGFIYLALEDATRPLMKVVRLEPTETDVSPPG